jgi:EmrB/QacA subfamily drug resistance transporter
VSSAAAPSPAASRPLAGAWPVIATTCLGAFAGQVDASIVQLGLPTLEQAFDARLGDVSWVATAYSLAFAAALPVYAKLAEFGGRKAMYVAGFALFGLFSALCGFAPDLGWLIVFRGLQGMAGALLGANSVVILVAASGKAGRGRAMGVFASAQAIGICTGPALGGLILQGLSWHWIFWVTVPVAVLGAVLGWLLVPARKASANPVSLDWPGALMLVPALVLVQLTITRLNAWGLSSATTLASVAAVLVLLVAFVRRELRTPVPLLDLRVFRSAAFSGGIAGVFLSYAILYGMFFTMSFALVRGFGDTPLQAGLRLAVIPVALGLVAPFAGRWADDRRLLVLRIGVGLCLLGLALLWQGLGSQGGRETMAMLALAVYGAGLGFFVAPNNAATLAAAPPDHAGQAGGLLNLMRALGTATGIASASSLLSWRLQDATGAVRRTDTVAQGVLLSAVRDVVLLLAVLVLVAGIAATLRDRKTESLSPAPPAS